jgi:ribonuclease P protein component
VNFAFTSSQRIRQSNVFEQAFKQKAYSNKWFSIHILESKLNFARLGMVVSKRTMTKSVHRNYAKRLIREVFRINSTQLPALDFVVRLRRKLTQDNSADARLALIELMLSAKNI